jgi:hydroxyacylglutathione hydrolase
MSSQGYTIQRIPHLNLSSFLVYRTGEALLVDPGNRGYHRKILETMNSLGLDPDMLRLVILTHVHFDHTGAAGALREITGCKIAVHPSEEERLLKGRTPVPAGTRWKAKILARLGSLVARRIMAFPGTTADILTGEEMSLESYGFAGKVIHTPGHTPGSQVILMDNGELIAGDTMIGLPGHELFPPFAEDPAALLKSWEMISKLPVRIIYPAHGVPVTTERFLREYPAAIKKYGG